MTEPLETVVQGIAERINESIAVLLFAQSGLTLIRLEQETFTPFAENPDPIVLVGDGDPNDPNNRPVAFWKRSELLRQIELDGPAYQELARQWVVSLYATWDESLRPRYAAALGVTTDEVRIPAFGDLRRIRHDIVHNAGVASVRYSANCEVLQWFEGGDEISLSTQQLLQFIDELPWLVMPYRF